VSARPPPPRGLAALQERFWRLVSAPQTVDRVLPRLAAEDPSLAPLTGWIRAGSEPVALERLNVYANMYFFRLLGVVREDYPCLEKLLGADPFHDLVTDYLVAHPSQDPSVRHVGARLAALLEDHPRGRAHPAAADLARLEWARGLAFDRADAAPLTAGALGAVPAEDWGALRFTLVPSFQILRLGHPVHILWQALERGEPPPPIEPGRSELLVWRRGFQVYHRLGHPSEADLLASVAAGAPLGQICEALLDGRGEEQAVQAAFERLRSWIDQGLLAGIAA
jgi:hypothetical protein